MEKRLISIVETACAVYADERDIPAPKNYKMIAFLDSSANTQCAVFKSKDTLLVAFRGSQEARDYIQDIKLRKVEFTKRRPKSKVHRGFNQAYRDVRVRLHKIYSTHKKDVKEVIFTGHSLGGALATLASYDFKLDYNDEVKVSCVSLGSPRVGNRWFAKDFNKMIDDTTRIVNGGDPVTQLPSWWHLRYWHVGGQLRVGKLPWAAVFKALISPKVSLLGYHKCDNYIENLKSIYSGGEE
jgi:hypothetical protein